MRKKAARTTRKKPPAVPVKPLRRLGDRVLEHVRSTDVELYGKYRKGRGGFGRRRRTKVDGVRLPPDLCAAAWVYSYVEFREVYGGLTREHWTPLEDEFGRQRESLTGRAIEVCAGYGPAPTSWKEAVVSEEGWLYILRGMELCFRRGFYLALLRYAEDLKTVPEVTSIKARLSRGRRKGAEANKRRAEPGRLKHRKRFRELRGSGFTKTQAREVIHQETGISVRQLERDTKGLS